MAALQTDNPDWITRLIRASVSFSQDRAQLVISVGAVAAVVAIVYAACRLEFKTDRFDLVNPSADYAIHYNRYKEAFGEDLDLVAVIEGDDRARMTAALETIAGEIAKHPDCFSKLCHRIRIDELKAKGLFQLDLVDLRRIKAHIDTLRPLLLLNAWDSMTVENLLAHTRFSLATSNGEKPLDAASREVLTNATGVLQSLTGTLRDPTSYRTPWKGLFGDGGPNRGAALRAVPEYFFSENGRLAFLRAAPVRDTGSFTNFARPVAQMQRIIAQARQDFPELTFGLTGLPALENDEMQAAKSSSLVSTLLSIVGVSLVFVIAFRGLRHPMLAVLTLAASAGWTMGFVTLTVGHLNIISVSFIVTLIGLGIGYGILWLSQYEANRNRGVNAFGSNLQTAASAGPGIFTGAVTTALAFFTTLSTGFLGLCEMGFIAGAGILFCLAGVCTVLPALLVCFGRQTTTLRLSRHDSDPAFAWADRRPALVAAVLGVAMAALALVAPQLAFDYNLLNLQAHGVESVEWEKRLIDETKTSAWYALSIADTPEQVKELRAKFEALATVGRVVEIASIMPVQQPAKQPIIRDIHAALGSLPKEDQPLKLPAPRIASLASQLNSLGEFSSPVHPTDRALMNELSQAAADARKTVLGLAANEQGERVSRFEHRWIGDLLTQMRMLRDVSVPQPVTTADLPAALAPRYLSPSGKWLLQIFARSDVWDFAPLSEFCADVASVDPKATGHPISTLQVLTQMNVGYRRCAWLALAVIFAAVWIDFRNGRDALLAMAPLVLGYLAMFGVMVLFGLRLNPANMIALPLVLGTGVDFGVQVLHDFHNRPAGRYFLDRRLAGALIVTRLTKLIGFSSLLTASHWGKVSIGLVLSIGVITCTITALFWLPAVLSLLSTDRSDADEEPPATLPFRLAA